jgi:phage-related holin
VKVCEQLGIRDKFELYDLRRVVTSALFAVGTKIDQIMLMGGWTTSKTVFHHYIENIGLTNELRLFFQEIQIGLSASIEAPVDI